MKFSRIAVCVAAFGLWLPVSVMAQDVLGALSGVVEQQLLQGWQAGEQDGWYVLRNDSIAESEQTLTVKAGAPPSGGRLTSVNVSLVSNQPAAAIGIVARNLTDNGTCVGELAQDGAANLFCVINGEYQGIAKVEGAGKMDGSDVLELVEVPGSARFLVNGQTIGDIEYAEALGDEIGVMAYERGTFGLADFAITRNDTIETPASGSGLPPRGGGGGAATPAEELPAQGGAPAGDDRMGQIMGPLGPAITDGPRPEGWELFFEDDWLVLVNADTASSENYFVMPTTPVTTGERVARVNVGILAPEGESAADFQYSSAGIIVESTQADTSCYGQITLGGDGAVLCFGADGKSTEMGRLAGAAKGDGTDVLEWVEQPGVAGFFLNNELIAQIDDPAMMGGDVGILAYERGDFYFGGFAISETGPGTASSGGKAKGGGSAAAPAAEEVPMFGHDEARLIGAYLGVTNGIFMHEFGHALIGELQLPSTGPEEDAVDIYSALKVVEPTMYPSGDEGLDAIGREVAIYSVLPWYYGGRMSEQTGFVMPWQDEHTGDLRRFRNTFCVIYGGNPGLYGHIAEQVGLDERTLYRCEEEFNKQNRAWRTILAPHTRISAWQPDGQQTVDAPGAEVRVVFETPRTPMAKFLVETFGEGLHGFAENLTKDYVLPRDIVVTYQHCGELNAWYSPNEGTVTMCYDLIEDQVRMIAAIESDGDSAAAAPQSPPQAESVPVAQTAMTGTAGELNELADYGVPPTNVLFPAPYRGPTPASHIRAETLTTATLVDLVTSGDNWLLVDTSGGAETLPGAFAVTDAGRDGSLTDSFQRLVTDWLTDETGGDKQVPIIFFGRDMQDRSSYNAALRAGTAGWQAYWYRGGIEAWRAHDLPMADQSE